MSDENANPEQEAKRKLSITGLFGTLGGSVVGGGIGVALCNHWGYSVLGSASGIATTATWVGLGIAMGVLAARYIAGQITRLDTSAAPASGPGS